jgi:hypothetical protein
MIIAVYDKQRFTLHLKCRKKWQAVLLIPYVCTLVGVPMSISRSLTLLAVGIGAGVAGTLLVPALMQTRPGFVSTPSVEQREVRNPIGSRQAIVSELNRVGFSCLGAVERNPDGNVDDVISCQDKTPGNSAQLNTASFGLGENASNRDRVVIRVRAFLREGDLKRVYERAAQTALQ